MSRRVYLLGVGLALVALALAFTDWALSLRPGVTEANVRRIREGMTMKEVELILGGRGEWWMEGTTCQRRDALWAWIGPHGRVFVGFGAFGDHAPLVVEWTRFRRTDGLSPLERLRAWLGW